MQLTARNILKYTLIIGFVGALIWYGYYQSREFRQGPQVSITYPTDGSTLEDNFVTLQGEAHNIAFISLRGRQIYTDTSGEFSESLLLWPGYNIITVAVTDTFGRTREEKIGVIVGEDGQEKRFVAGYDSFNQSYTQEGFLTDPDSRNTTTDTIIIESTTQEERRI